MFTSFGRKRSTRVPSPMRRSFASSLYARSLWARSLWARSLRCEQLEDRRLLAQLTVTTDQDIVDLNDGETSLREAIFAANIVPGADEIVFDFGHDGPATILLTQGELAITDALTITGPGAGLLTIDASGSDRPDPHNGSGSRIFQISSNATTLTRVTLGGIQLTGGNVAGDGGAVHAHADLILNQVNVVENYATDTGGGVALFDGSLTIVDSTIHGNSTGSRSVTSNYASGGGVYAEDASVIIAGSVISDNTAVGSGGGILASRSTLHIIDSLFHGNSGHVGGAINTGGPSFRMVNSTVSGNWTTDGAGGGIRTAGTISSIAHSTITGNVADVEHRGTGPGDGIFVASNASLTLDHTIVAGNGSPSVETHDIVSTKPYIASFSLIGAGAEYLAPLANNGGPTLTHALLPGSPAINAGERSIDGIPQYDQRGEPFRRVAGGRIDIGAYERQSFVVDNLADESDGDYGPGDLSLREAVDLANKFVGADTIEFSPLLTGGTIMVKIGSLPLRDDVQIIGLGAEQLTIDNSLTQGPIFNVDDSKNTLIAVGMSGLTLTGSKQSAIRSTEDLTVEDMIFRGNSAVQGAGINVLTGAALSPAPKLTVRDCRFDDNHAISATIGTGGGGGISFGSRGGELLVENSVFVGNSAATNGGAIAIAAFGTVVNITDTDFIDNEATRGGAVSISDDNSKLATLTRVEIRENKAAQAGGGIYVSGKAVTIVDSQIVGNRTTGTGPMFQVGGGGIFKQGGDWLVIEGSQLTENHSVTDGGGMALLGSRLDMTDSVLDGNTAAKRGGGMWLEQAASVDITRSTLSGNSAQTNGGGLYSRGNNTNLRFFDSTISGNSADGSGGGLSVASGSFLLNKSTVSGNSAAGFGGGLVVARGTRSASIQQSTITNNTSDDDENGIGAGGGLFSTTSPAINIRNTILAGNHDNTGVADDVSADYVSAYSLIGSGAEFLGPLADNGGPTQTHALLPGSPAINAGDPAVTSIPQFDQRGYPFVRFSSTAIDIGAFEAQPLVVDTLVDEDDGDYSQGDFSLREAIELANRIAGTNTIRFSPLLAGGTILLEQGELEISDAVEVVGLGAETLTIDAKQQSRIFSITATAGDFAFSGLKLTKASTSAPAAAAGGGAIRSASAGLLNLDGVHFVGNRTVGTEASGGAVFAAGNVRVEGSQFLENFTTGNNAMGGAIYATGDMTITGSKFTANQTAGLNASGGAVFTLRSLTTTGTGFVSNKTLGNNSRGGAVNARSVAMEGTTVSGNSTNGTFSYGGGISIGLGERPNGMTSSSIVDSFIIDNYTVGASSRGGGVSTAGTITVERSTISGNFTFGGNARGGGLYAGVGILRDNAFTSNRTYGAGSYGGGVAGSTSYGWQISNSHFLANQTFGSNSHGGALAAGRQLTITGSSFRDNSVAIGGGGAIFASPVGFNISISSSSFTGNSASFGGAIASRASATIVDSVLTNNRATGGSGQAGGGAIHQSSSSGNLTVLRSRISDNQAIVQSIFGGGGILSSGPTTISHSEISGNRAIGQGARGGGVWTRGQATITDSTISENRVIGSGGVGGGIFIDSGSGTNKISNSTISGNQITGEQGRGAGLYTDGRIGISHSTVTGNRVNATTGEAGGLWIPGGALGGPTGPRAVVSHSIVAGNFVGTMASDLRSRPPISYSLIGTKAGTEIIEAPIGSPDANGNLIGGPVHGVIDPLLAPLANNGGPTKTQALLPGSPAMNAGNPALMAGVEDTPLFDQRGAPFARVAGGRIDIGAYESQPVSGLYSADFDGDGDVDGRDFLLWQRGYGFQSSPPDRTTGDATGNGVVEGNDVVVWQEMYGNGLSGTGSQQSARQELRTESREPERSMAPWAVTGLDDARGRDRWYDDNSEPVSDLPANGSDYAVTVDRAFDHWLPPRRFATDFGDLVVHRMVRRHALG